MDEDTSNPKKLSRGIFDRKRICTQVKILTELNSSTQPVKSRLLHVPGPSSPKEESHEIALFANPAFAHVAFKVSSLAELRSFHARVVARSIPIKFAFNHSASFAFYFEDPDGNLIEVYWPTGDLTLKQPQVLPLDLSLSDDDLLQQLASMA